jgi:hypothetical protein
VPHVRTGEARVPPRRFFAGAIGTLTRVASLYWVSSVEICFKGTGGKGVYHINSVDEVTQWQIVGATAQISEVWLLPVLETMLEQFPFPIRGFHSDNELNASRFLQKDDNTPVYHLNR